MRGKNLSSNITHRTITIEEVASILEGGNFVTTAQVGSTVYAMISGPHMGKLVIVNNFNGEGLVLDSPD